MKEEILERLSNAIINSDEEAAKKAAVDALKAEIDPMVAITDGLNKGMDVIGERFRKFEIFLPNVMLAADAMKAAVAVLRPHIKPERMTESVRGKVVIATIFGDVHDIGKNLVAVMLELAGFEVHDLGCDVQPMKFIDKAEEIGANIIAMSSLLTPCMFYHKDVIISLKDMGNREKYWIMVGGGAITPEWAEEIGADGWGRNANDAVEVAKILMKQGREVKRPVVIGE